MWDVTIIGGGASGLAAALTAARSGAQVLLLEKEKRLGRKLAATGNGWCNFTHKGFTTANYHGATPYFISEVLNTHHEADTLAFFSELGVVAFCDERGRYYPYSKNAGAVVDALRFACADCGVTLRTEAPVDRLLKKGDHFTLRTKEKIESSRTVIIACGGEAAPQLGGCRDGYDFLRHLGHDLIPTRPAIVQLVAKEEAVRALKGLHWQVVASASGRKEAGELLFTGYGLSGPVILQLSEALSAALVTAKEVPVTIDLLPDWQEERLVQTLKERRRLLSDRALGDFFVGFLPRPLASALLRAANSGKQNRPVKDLSDNQLAELAHLAKAFVVPVIGTRPFRDAQATAGGIDCADFDPASLMSWRVSGLFACGEVLDVLGDCGGYNLQWAWSSGRLAGRSAALWADATGR